MKLDIANYQISCTKPNNYSLKNKEEDSPTSITNEILTCQGAVLEVQKVQKVRQKAYLSWLGNNRPKNGNWKIGLKDLDIRTCK